MATSHEIFLFVEKHLKTYPSSENKKKKIKNCIVTLMNETNHGYRNKILHYLDF